MSLVSLAQQTSSPHHSFLAELAASVTMLVQSVVTFFMLAYAPDSRVELLEWILLPLMGSVCAAVGAFCLNTQPELRRVVIGRCFCTLVIGLVGPRFLSIWWPWATTLLADPFMKIGAGFAFGAFTYVISYFAFIRFYANAPAIANQLMQRAEDRLVGKISTQVASNVSQVAQGVATELASNPLPETPAHTAEVVANVSKQTAEANPQ